MKRISNVLFFLANVACSFLPMHNEIILESHPDYSCNTYELYKKLIKEGVNKRFKITWLVNDPNKFKGRIDDKNVSFLSIKPKSFLRKIALYVRCNRAKLLITGNRHVQKYKVSKKQLNINIEHGSPIKDCSADYKRFFCDYIITQSPFFTETTIKQYRLPEKSIIPLGLPRNDQLFKKSTSLSKVIPNIRAYKKVICWMPTFREHFDGKRIDSKCNFPLGLPVFYDLDSARELNMLLVSLDSLLIIKPHPAQDLSKIHDLHLSNIKLLYNSHLEKESIQVNEFLSQTDALITDYSGVYFDYLLLDRPIGITLDDFDEYRSSKGFVYDDFKGVVVGDYIYNVQDFIRFIKNVCANIDPLLEKRKRIKTMTNAKPFDESSQRLFDFLSSKIQLK